MKPVPKDAKYLATLTKVPAQSHRSRWRDADGDRIFEWDSLHGELEVYNSRGRHLGAMDPETGIFIKPAVQGRRINV